MSKQITKTKPVKGKGVPITSPSNVAPAAVVDPKKVKAPRITTEAPLPETNELALVNASAPLSLRDLTTQRYQSRGWQIMNTPRGGINDLVAGKSVGGKYKYHFVQFIESEDDIDNAPRYKGEAKGAFIQNAYSNQATPVYVIPRRSGVNRKVVLENADTAQKIIP